MSSDMFIFDEPYYTTTTTTNMISAEEISSNFFSTDPISTLSDSSIDSFLQEISDDQNTTITTTTTAQLSGQISADEVQSLDQITHALFSNSPPSHQLETLSLQQTHLSNLQNSTLENVLISDNYTGIPEVKTEEFQLGFDYFSPSSYNSYFLNENHVENNMLKFMQRSYSSNSFEAKNPAFLFQPKFDSLMEVHNTFSPSDIDNSQMRRVCSTGDLPKVGATTAQQQVCATSPLSGGGATTDGKFMEDANFKVGKYSAEERKERIDRYRAKRTQRNFNKTIKYACRKTLADNRPRIRGRFARNDETGEIPKPTCFNRYEDDDDLWVDNLQEEEERILGRGGGRFLRNYGATQFQYYGY